MLDRYSEARNLSEALCEAGRSLLETCEAEVAASQPAPLLLHLERVSLVGFGSFSEPAEYPLDNRGLVLLRGSHGDALAEPDGDAALGSAPLDPLAGALDDAGVSSNGASTGTLAEWLGGVDVAARAWLTDGLG